MHTGSETNSATARKVRLMRDPSAALLLEKKNPKRAVESGAVPATMPA
jgi:hypothetical protein